MANATKETTLCDFKGQNVEFVKDSLDQNGLAKLKGTFEGIWYKY